MKPSYFWLIGIAAVLVLFGLLFIIKTPAPNLTITPTGGSQNVNTGGGQTTIQPINTNVGTVSGIDLSLLAAEGNESALNASADGASDTNYFSSSDSFNSAIDSISNPIQ